ncbi:FG-GAP repeat protein [Phytomonospora sp. NPDC050363]|uniref:FG-GAP repeat protein n=1 Tax=Phytomonospora sp. NPDC050363 TaxID=3155642 RepID=UPI0033C097E8
MVYPSSNGEQVLSQNTPGVPGSAETGDFFGRTYASADFNGDGCDELIVGSPGEDDEAGMVTIINGSPAGLVPSQSVAYTQNTPGVPGGSERLDRFGDSLAAGATASGQAYLLVGSPGEALGSRAGAGSVHYLRGDKWRTFHQDTPGVAGAAERSDGFGGALASSERYFVVGASRETLSGDWAAGQVHVFSHTIVDGVPDPLATISQDSAGVSGTAEFNDYFGESVSIVSYRPSATAAIGALVAVGSPGEALGADEEAGMAHVLAVTPSGKFSEVADINQDTTDVADSTQEDDAFGTELVFGVADGGPVATPSTAVLVVSALWEDSTDDDWGGAIHVFTDVRKPGRGDLLFKGDGDGPFQGSTFVDTLGATAGHLHVGYDGDYTTTIPWPAVLGG